MRLNYRFFTERGLRVFLILPGLVGLAAFFRDIFLAILALGIGGFMLYDYRKTCQTVRKIDKLVKLSTDSLKEVLVAGQSRSLRLSCEVNTDLVVSLSSPLREVKIKPGRLQKGGYEVEFLFSSDLSGYYRLDKIKTQVIGPYGISRKNADISLNLEFRVFPRVMVALIRAALFLLREERGGEGDIPTRFKGPGTEYADTREYTPGDSLHYIDWKATARYGKLMVKEFFLEAGRGAHIIYDVRAAGPISQDKLATDFLNTCLGVVEQGYPVGVTVHDGDRVLLHSTDEPPRQVLKMAMGYVLESMEADLEDIDRLIDPLTSAQIRKFLRGVKEERIKRMLEFEAKVIQDKLGEPHRFLVRLSRQIDEPRHFLLISQLSGEIVEILQLTDEIRSRHQLTIIQPTQPWREAKSLEEAYRWYERIKKVEGLLTRQGVQLFSSLPPPW